MTQSWRSSSLESTLTMAASPPTSSSTGPGPAPQDCRGGSGWPGSASQPHPASSPLQSSGICCSEWHQQDPQDWGIGRCCWASYRRGRRMCRTHGRSLLTGVCATTESLVFQISPGGGNRLVHLVDTTPVFFTSPPSSGINDHRIKNILRHPLLLVNCSIPYGARGLANRICPPFTPGLIPALPIAPDPHVLLAEGAGLCQRASWRKW